MKKFIQIITIVMIFISILAITLNMTVISGVKNHIKNIDSEIDFIKSEYAEMNLQLETLPYTNENNIEISKANVYTKLIPIENSIDDINITLNKIDDMTLLTFSKKIDISQRYLSESHTEIHNLKSILAIINSSNEITQIAKLNITSQNFYESITSIMETYQTLTNDFLDTYINIINFTIVMIILISFTRGYVSLNFISRNYDFALKGFKLLENHNYDLNMLPEINPKFSEEIELDSIIRKIINEQKFSTDIKELLMSNYEMDELLEALFENIEHKLSVDRIGIAFIDYHNNKIMAEHGVANYDNILVGPGYDIQLDSTSLQDIVKSKEAKITYNIVEELEKRPQSISLKLFYREGIRSSMAIPLIMKDTVFGILFFSSQKESNFDEESLRVAKKLTYDITGFLNRSYLTKVVFSRITNVFSELVDRKDNETGGHIKRMVKYSVLIAEGLMDMNEYPDEVNKKFIVNIERHASSHDLGKVGVPDEVLKKPGKLSAHEWEIMKSHASAGGDIFKDLRDSLKVFNSEFYKVAEEISRYHHEKWDGTGYPEQLIGNEIPLSARIVALADVFDALTSKRVYKSAYSFDESVSMITELKGSQFDPVVVDAFLLKLSKVKNIYNLDSTPKY